MENPSFACFSFSTPSPLPRAAHSLGFGKCGYASKEFWVFNRRKADGGRLVEYRLGDASKCDPLTDYVLLLLPLFND